MDDNLITESNAKKIQQQINNGLVLSFTFSIVEACLIGVISLQTALSSSLIYYATGVFYVAYVSGFLFTPTIASRRYGIGTKRSLLLGLLFLSVYMISQVFVYWHTTFPGAIIGGIGASLIWTSEGMYMTATAVKHAKLKEAHVEPSLGYFSGIFYTIFQACLIFAQLFSSFLLTIGNEAQMRTLIYVSYSIASCLAILFGAFYLPDIDTTIDSKDFSSRDVASSTKSLLNDQTMVESMTATLRNCFDYRTYLMIPSNIAHGLLQNFQYDFFNKYVIGKNIGNKYIGYVGSLISIIAALEGIPIGKASGIYGRLVFFGLGALCNVIICLIILSWEIQPDYCILSLLIILIASNNAVWGTLNAAIVGDFFHEDPAPAFANMKMWSGAPTALAFFLFHKIDITIRMIILLIITILGYVGYIIARKRFRKPQSTSSSPVPISNVYRTCI